MSVALEITVAAQPSIDWDRFVAAMPGAPVYLQSRWPLAAKEAFGHEACFLEARTPAEGLVGVLPLMRQKSWLLGNFLTSLPFFNYGGVLTESEQVATALMTRAAELGEATGSKYVEFRDHRPREGDWVCRNDKITMVRELPGSAAELSKQLGSKLRSQIKRAERENPEVVRGGADLLDDFYTVFAANMRDLGTPVYPKRFFETLLARAPDVCRLVCVRRGGQPAAAAFLITHNQTTEIPWAACLAEAKPLGFNMRLYWEALCEAIDNGAERFDFGRSSVDSGTYRFKKQWGAQPQPLHWYRWERRRTLRQGTSSYGDSAQARMVAMWQRLPLPVANWMGPVVSPYLPW